jgi:hypothetical protein
LHPVAVPRLGATPLVLDRDRSPGARQLREQDACPFRAVELDHVCYSVQPQDQGPQSQTAHYPQIAARLISRLMDALVQGTPLGRQPVLLPHPFKMDQGALPLAEEQVLQGGEREKVGFGVPAWHVSLVCHGSFPLHTASDQLESFNSLGNVLSAEGYSQLICKLSIHRIE